MHPVVIIVGEHPQEVSALELGKGVYERLRHDDYKAFLERMPLKLTPVGSVVKGLEPVDERVVRIAWLREVFARYGDDAFCFSFHNGKYPGVSGIEIVRYEDITYPPIWEFSKYKGFVLEIPAVFKPTRNNRLLEHYFKVWKEFHEENERKLRNLLRKRMENSEIASENIDEKVDNFVQELHEIASKSGLNPIRDVEERARVFAEINSKVVNLPSTFSAGLFGDYMVQTIYDMIKDNVHNGR